MTWAVEDRVNVHGMVNCFLKQHFSMTGQTHFIWQQYMYIKVNSSYFLSRFQDGGDMEQITKKFQKKMTRGL